MIPPPPLPADRSRLDALARYAILDTDPEEAFDEIAGLASTICAAPIALISLVDETRQWFKARKGLDIRETPRALSFCAHAIAGEDLFIVPDARADPRFHDNPLVLRAPGIRFYAGALLTTPDGHNLGALCVIDREPRALTGVQYDALRALARQVIAQLELRRQLAVRSKAERELDLLFDLSFDLHCIAGFDGCFRRLNPAFETVLGYRLAELPAMPFLDLVHADDRETTIAKLARLRGEAQAERMKQAFVSTVSHELRTPLTSIRGSLGLLASGVMGELGDDARQLVTVAERNSVRLIALINDILDFERLENGRMEMDLRPMPLLRMLERSIETISASAMQDGVDIELRCPRAIVLGDETRLGQVTTNLLSNAVKYSKRGDTIVVSAQLRDGSVEVRVEDRGRGIPPAMQHRLFRRFVQIDSSDARTKPGTGLGLAICRAIIEQHGGTIGVESREEEGSAFWFRVRLAGEATEPGPQTKRDAGRRWVRSGRGAPQSTGPSQRSAARLRRHTVRFDAGEGVCRMKVLVVDDEEDVRFVAQMSLERVGGMTVVQASSGEEGIARARSEQPDFILLDMMMPGMDGAATFRQLRASEETASIPVVFLTAKAMAPEVQRLKDLGAKGVVLKPFNPLTLAAEVAAILNE